MRAVIFKGHGDIDRLIYTEVPEPKIGPSEALIRVKACALNHLDIWTREGMSGIKIPLPHILGCDISGEVEKVGANVKNVAPKTCVVVAPEFPVVSANGVNRDGIHFAMIIKSSVFKSTVAMLNS